MGLTTGDSNLVDQSRGHGPLDPQNAGGMPRLAEKEFPRAIESDDADTLRIAKRPRLDGGDNMTLDNDIQIPVSSRTPEHPQALPTPEPDVIAVVPRRGRGRPKGSKDSYQRTRRKKRSRETQNVETSTYFKSEYVGVSRAECNSIRADVKKAVKSDQPNYKCSLDHKSSIHVAYRYKNDDDE